MTRSWTLVTGASGFVGSRLVRHLVARGERVKAFVRPGANLSALTDLPPERLELAFGDILVEGTVYRALAGCARAYHVASVFRWWDPRPERIIEPAVLGTQAVLAAARHRELERVVVTSSLAALGNEAKPHPITEQHELVADGAETYAIAKREALRVAEHAAASGQPLVIVMPSAVLGPGDWKPTPAGRAIVRFLNQSVRVPYVRGGLSVADVDDVVRGHALAMDHGTLGQRYLLGGENLTFQELLGHLAELTGLRPPRRELGPEVLAAAGWASELAAWWTNSEPTITTKLARRHFGRFAWADSTRAERDLGYERRPLVETLRRSVRWFVEQGAVREPRARRLRHELATGFE